jgi:hypothetical protein
LSTGGPHLSADHLAEDGGAELSGGGRLFGFAHCVVFVGLLHEGEGCFLFAVFGDEALPVIAVLEHSSVIFLLGKNVSIDLTFAFH